MFDAALRKLVDPPLDAAGRRIAAAGISADALTLAGFACGVAAAAAVVLEAFGVAMAFVVANRLADGLDGAVARATARTDRGGYLDIVLDFFFYGVFPFGFALANPGDNALPAAALLLTFYMNGAAFLGFAVMAERRGLSTTAQGVKSLYYLGGLAEGAETIAVFITMCLLPGWFPVLAYGFAVVCAVSAVSRLLLVARLLSD